jgi:hypothetical protein
MKKRKNRLACFPACFLLGKMKAIVETQGQQLMIREGDILSVNRYVGLKAGDVINLKKVLFVGEGPQAKMITAALVKRMALPSSIPHVLTFYGALVVLVLLVYLSFFLGCKFSKYLTPPILKIIEKLAGMLITCLAIGSILNGTRMFLQSL